MAGSITTSATPTSRARSAEPRSEPTKSLKKNSDLEAAPPASIIAISLGGNHEDSKALMRRALGLIGEDVDDQPAPLRDLRVSSLYLTRPVGGVPQRDFLNAAVAGKTSLRPAQLIALLKAIEWRFGRRPSQRWGPRPLDLDLLLYGDVFVTNPELSLPHPRLRQRRFYLEPLAEIASEIRVPPDEATVGKLLDALPPGRLRRLSWSDSIFHHDG